MPIHVPCPCGLPFGDDRWAAVGDDFLQCVQHGQMERLCLKPIFSCPYQKDGKIGVFHLFRGLGTP